jgi:hypothetical protein
MKQRNVSTKINSIIRKNNATRLLEKYVSELNIATPRVNKKLKQKLNAFFKSTNKEMLNLIT